mgnify:CR=1 FL=1
MVARCYLLRLESDEAMDERFSGKTAGPSSGMLFETCSLNELYLAIFTQAFLVLGLSITAYT